MKVLKFSATWCQPCKMYSPVFKAVTKNLGIESQELDIDEDKEQTAKYVITSVPTTVLIDEFGEEIKRVSGALPKKALEEFLEV